MENVRDRIAILGMGYVGLPLAVAFAKKYSVIGFDINKNRIDQLNSGLDVTLEVNNDLLKSVLNANVEMHNGLMLTQNIIDIKKCNIYIITVPTPIDKYNRPNLAPLVSASKTVASVLKRGDIVIYESTVYPGVTEEEMVHVLESNSHLEFNKDFYCGYSPERINPGDKSHTVTQILKITSGSTPEIAEFVDKLYKSIITAGTYKAPSIKVAEAAKVIENAQRDLNIAFVNELSKIFNLMGIDTNDVLDAAATKWNFLKFKPGLVGGHCIGVDPYYLAQKAQELGYHPEVILAGRRLNDSMGKYVATEIVMKMVKSGLQVYDSKIMILGFTFKENCPDFRNTKVADIYNELKNYDIDVEIYDPWVNSQEVFSDYGIELSSKLQLANYSAVVIAVAHDVFKNINVRDLIIKNGIVYDIKGFMDKNHVDFRL